VFAVAALGIGPVLGQANAGTITYVTPSGATINGLPVDAEAVFTTGTDTLTITLTNLEANPTSVAQNLSDLTFTLSGGTITSLSSSSGQEITVNSNGTFSPGSTVSTGAIAPVPRVAGLFPGFSPVTRLESAASARGSLEW
jgi:hypothetical protein